MPRPEVGRPLPRAADAWTGEVKWRGWVLTEPGHGADWRRAVGDDVLDGLRRLITAELEHALVTEIRDLGRLGVSCRVPLSIRVGGRIMSVRTVWHYEADGATPRLVTAFPET
jgi:hypothetical protein